MHIKFSLTLMVGTCAIVVASAAGVEGLSSFMGSLAKMQSAEKSYPTSAAGVGGSNGFMGSLAKIQSAEKPYAASASEGETAATYLQDHPLTLPALSEPSNSAPESAWSLAPTAQSKSFNQMQDTLYSQHPALWEAIQVAGSYGLSLQDVVAGPVQYNPSAPTTNKSTLLTNGVVGWWTLPTSAGQSFFVEKGTTTPIPYGIAIGSYSNARPNTPEGTETWVENPFTAPAPTWTNQNASWIATWMAVHEGMYNPITNLYYKGITSPAYSQYPGYQAASILQHYGAPTNDKYQYQVFQNAWEFWLVDAEINQHLLTLTEGQAKLTNYINTENSEVNGLVSEAHYEQEEAQQCGTVCQVFTALAQTFGQNW